jgi:hypothetical protein
VGGWPFPSRGISPPIFYRFISAHWVSWFFGFFRVRLEYDQQQPFFISSAETNCPLRSSSVSQLARIAFRKIFLAR